MDVFDLQATLSLDSSQYERGLNNASMSAKGFANTTGSVGKGVGKITQGFTVLKGVAANLVTGGINLLANAITSNLGEAFNRVDTLTNYTKVMTNLGYDAGEASHEIDRLANGINDLPTTLPQIVAQQQEFTALGISLKDSTDLTLALNNATLAGGQGQAAANSAMAQWYQIIAAGKSDLMSMRIINQAMPAQLDAIAKSVLGAKANWSDLHEAWKSDPEITGKVKKALLDLNENGYEVAGKKVKSFAEQAYDANRTIETSITNIGVNIQKGLADVIENGIGQGAIIDSLDSLKQGIKETFSEIKEFIIDIKEVGFARALSDEMDKGLKKFKNSTKDLDLASMLDDVLNSIVESAPMVTEKFGLLFGEVSSWLYGKTIELANSLGIWIIEMLPIVIDAIAIALDTFYQNIDTWIDEKVPSLVEQAVIAIVKAAPKIVVALIKLGAVLYIRMSTIGVRMVTALIRGLLKTVGTLYTTLVNIGRNAVNKIKTSGWFNVGVSMISGVIRGVGAKARELANRVKNIVLGAYNAAKNALDINSPSKKFERGIGYSIPEGVALGVQRKEKLAINAVRDMEDKLAEPNYDNDFVAYDENEPELETETMMDVLSAGSNNGIGVNTQPQRDLTVVLQLDKMQLAKTIYKLNNEETQRVGATLIGGLA